LFYQFTPQKKAGKNQKARQNNMDTCLIAKKAWGICILNFFSSLLGFLKIVLAKFQHKINKIFNTGYLFTNFL